MTLALDPSTPAVAAANAQTVTSASFTPPAGAVIYAIAMMGVNNQGDPRDMTLTSSNGLTWTQRGTTPGTPGAVAGNGDLVRVYTATVASSAAMTVTATITTNGFNGCALRVLVYTGADAATPVEGVVVGGSVSAVISQAITTTTDGAIPYLGASDWNGGAAPTAGGGTTTDAAPTAYSSRQWVARRATAAVSPAGSVTIASSAPTSGRNAWVGFAVKPAAGAPDDGTLKVRLGGAWVDAQLRVRVGGAWVDADVTPRVGGAWA